MIKRSASQVAGCNDLYSAAGITVAYQIPVTDFQHNDMALMTPQDMEGFWPKYKSPPASSAASNRASPCCG
jgi:hypothetical protein